MAVQNYDQWYASKYPTQPSRSNQNVPGSNFPGDPIFMGVKGSDYDRKNSQQTKDEYSKWAADATKSAAEEAMQKNIDKNTANAKSLRDQATDFKSNLPGYISGQVNAATDSARGGLVNDLQKVKQNSNARGLLYSGINTENQDETKGAAGARLGQSIQDINTRANSQSDYKNQLATNAENDVDNQNANYANYQAQAAQTVYQQALQEAQNQQSFFSDIFGGVAGLGGAIAGGLIGGPVGAVAGGTAGSKLGGAVGRAI